MLYVRKVDNVYVCHYCEGIIYGGAKTIATDDECKNINGVTVKVTRVWHPECFLKDDFNGKKGEEIFKELIVTLLPLIVNPDDVKNLILALSM